MSARCRAIRSLSLVLSFAGCLGSGAVADAGVSTHCAPSPGATPLATATASAGFLANLGNRANSIRAASKQMLSSSIEIANSHPSRQRIIFKSIPELSKKTTADDQMCERLEAATISKPIEFDHKRFVSVDALTDWIMDFTQGKGAEGKSLYEQCPGKCSPQYTWWIDPDESGLLVKARAVCGLPRDHDGNKYQLSIALMAVCPAAESQ
jgi:hypothetical protein